MNGDFPRKPWIAALVGLMVLVALAVGFTSYQAGVSRGLALQPPPAVAAAPNGAAPQAAPAPYYYPRYRYRGWGGFGFVGGLFTLLIWIFLFRLLFRALFGWGWWGWRRRYWGGYGCYGGPYGGYDGPHEFDEWHRRAHDRMRDQGSTPPPATA
jgi:hypothetical protein